METDPVLAQFRAQFVPLKVETAGEEWAKWATKYPPEGRGIPIIYVIRADGEKLYGKTGSLPGDELPRMMLAAVKSSGRSFSPAEFAVLSTTLHETKQALDENDLGAAVGLLARLDKIGEIGELSKGSYSSVAAEADELAKKIIDSAKAEMELAKAKLSDPAKSVEGLLTLLQAERTFKKLSHVQRPLADVIRGIERDAEMKPFLEQAQMLDYARRQAAKNTTSFTKRAISLYERMIERFPDTPAAQLARDELATLDPQSAALKPQPQGGAPPPNDYRKWTDASGSHSLEAVLVEVKQGWVQLKRRDGELVALPISKLSQADQEHLKKRP